MTIWIDAQLSPSLALWINESFHQLNAKSVTALGLRDANDMAIFNQGREQNAIIMTKDEDFVHLLDRFGSPPSILL